ncbi:cold shock domain-containing protein 3-like [Belonocnema kinseyi]|uniref:cold shock domain-containing protein 3-like n=1 Tax=Belonocnema kinseyi TaxID=2817044 RepID=UPI00143DB182|nr:cold shock domain-containing protein 3-like [Belonocnema kinseyi]
MHIRGVPPGRSADSRKMVEKEGKHKSPNCFCCKESGHVKRDCLKWKSGKCFKCGEVGHFARDCVENHDQFNEHVSSSTASSSASGGT